jgi:hypothetical protein
LIIQKQRIICLPKSRVYDHKKRLTEYKNINDECSNNWEINSHNRDIHALVEDWLKQLSWLDSDGEIVEKR